MQRIGSEYYTTHRNVALFLFRDDRRQWRFRIGSDGPPSGLAASTRAEAHGMAVRNVDAWLAGRAKRITP